MGGARFLSDALVQTEMSLESLNPANNEIDCHGAGWLALAVRNNNLLQSMDVRGNPIGVDGVHEFAIACGSVASNLVLADGEDFIVRVCGRRNAMVLVDGVPQEPPEPPLRPIEV